MKKVIAIVFGVLLLTLFYFGTPWLKLQLDIDSCLDRGGRWNYETKVCEIMVVYVTFTYAGDNQIALIKAYRQVSGLGLKEAEDIVKNNHSVTIAPVSSNEAKEIKEIIEKAGGKAEIRISNL